MSADAADVEWNETAFMHDDILDDITAILSDKFQVDSAKLGPDTTLESLGLDSLTLMEFVFAVEDRYSLRVPEDKLDPRQTGITLARLAEIVGEERGKAASTAPVDAA